MTNLAEELADIALRLIDVAVMMGVDLVAEIEKKAAKNRTRKYKHGKRY